VVPAFSADLETYRNLKKFNEILDLVEKNYVEEVNPSDVIKGAIDGMMKTLDPHSTYMTKEMYSELQVDTKGFFGGLGIVISMKEDMLTVVSPVEDTPAFKAGIKAGDQIIKIEGKDTKGIGIMDAVHKLRGPKGTSVTISIMREGFDKIRDFTITRDIIKIKSVKQRIFPDGIGYIRISSFQESTADELKEALEALNDKNHPVSGLVIDLRNNPGGLLDQAITVSDQFLKSGVIVSTKGRKDIAERIYKADDSGREPECPIIILINGGSASASEIVSGALRDNGRALLMGTQTFGKGVMQMIIPLKDGSAVKLTTARYFTPSGICIQAKGITPDIHVESVSAKADIKEKKNVIREKDLEGHLKADQPEEEESLEPENEGIESDYQLMRAIDLLKGWDIFNKMRKAQAVKG
jgi:carboxyl-terminal processing protease